MQRRTVDTTKASLGVIRRAEVTYLSWSNDDPPSSPECYDYEDDFESLDESSEGSNDGEVPGVENKDKQTADVSDDGQVPDNKINKYYYSEEGSDSLNKDKPTAEVSDDGQVPGVEYNYSKESSEYLDMNNQIADVSNERQVPGRLPQTENGQVDDGTKKRLETTDSGPHLCRSLSEPSQSKARMVNFKNYIQGRQSYEFGRREEIIIPLDELVDEKKPQINVDSELRLFRSCIDIKLFADYYVVSVNNKIIKYSLDSDQQLDQLTVPGAGRMCYIRMSSRIAVIQTPDGVICLETKPRLFVVYSIRVPSIQYMSICHLDSFHRAVNDRNGLPNPMHTFAATATSRLPKSGLMDEYIYIIKPEYDRHQTNNCYNGRSTRQLIPGLSGICSVHAFLKDKKLCLIVGCKDRVCCVSLADKSIKWKIHLNYPATDVQFSDSYVFVCVQDGCRLFVCDYKSGRIVIDNLLNKDGIRGCKPHKLSVYKSIVLVKFYNNNNYWSCVADMNSNSSVPETRHGFPLGTIRISKAL